MRQLIVAAVGFGVCSSQTKINPACDEQAQKPKRSRSGEGHFVSFALGETHQWFPNAKETLATERFCAKLGAAMYDFPLTGAQKTFLRGLGQKLAPALKTGKQGLTPAFFQELQHLLNARELVKLRFLGADRDERAALCARIADEGRCVSLGSVGHTALFYRQQPDPAKRQIALPEKIASGGGVKDGHS